MAITLAVAEPEAVPGQVLLRFSPLTLGIPWDTGRGYGSSQPLVVQMVSWDTLGIAKWNTLGDTQME